MKTELPRIGLGTWQTFDAGGDRAARGPLKEVLQALHAAGGRLVDSSPMYGRSEEVVGDLAAKLGVQSALFLATKVWTSGKTAGVRQMEASMRKLRTARIDLMQVHNLLDWEAHLPTLKDWKSQKRLRYLGITTSHGRRHGDMLELIDKQPDFDFVQFSYSIGDREAEEKLLPAARARGKAVLINRPFRTGELFERVRGKPLPEWAAEIGCAAWSQFFLKFVVSHPAVTCAIPATTRVDHVRENLAAAAEPLPGEAMRRRIAEYVGAL